MNIPFVKMQAQGNDFVILDAMHDNLPALEQTFIRQICDRHFGVGCDQLLVLQKHKQADALMLIFNADGSQAANCGNGLRCVGALLMQKITKDNVSIALADRVVQAQRTKQGICVLMGQAEIEHVATTYTDINIGNPHRVYFESVKPCLERNVEIIHAYDKQSVNIHIVERGAGATLACGSGACAVAVAVWHRLGEKGKLSIEMPGGDVCVFMRAKDLYLEGKVSFVYQGDYCC